MCDCSASNRTQISFKDLQVILNDQLHAVSKIFTGTCLSLNIEIEKNDLILTPEKQDKTLELSKYWSPDSIPARNEVIMKKTYSVNQ